MIELRSNCLTIVENRWTGQNGIKTCNDALLENYEFDIKFDGKYHPFSTLGFLELTFFLFKTMLQNRDKKIVYFSYGPTFTWKWSSRLRNIVVIHDTYFLDLNLGFGWHKYTFFKYIYRVMCNSFDSILTVSNFSKVGIETWLGKQKKIEIVYNGIDRKFLEKKAQSQNRYDEVVFVGNTKPHKGFEILRSSFVAAECKTVKSLNVVGIQRPDEHFEDGRVIRYLTNISSEELRCLYQDCLFLIIPSKSEGFCLPALECLAAGGRVIHSGMGAIGEIVGPSPFPIDLSDPEANNRLFNLEENDFSEIVIDFERFSWQAAAHKIADVIREYRNDAN